MPKQTRITLLALKIHQRKAIHILLQEQYKERLTIENNYYMELSTLFRITGQKIINEYKECIKKGITQQNTEVIIQVILDGLAKDYKKLQEKYQEKTRKTAIKQIKQIKEKQKKKQLGQERPGHEKTAYKFINTLLQTKIKPKLEKIYKIKPNKKVKKEIRENKKDLSKTILSKPTKKPKNATNTLLQTPIKNQVTQRINKEIKEILKTSETEGIGTKQVAEKLQKKFNQLKGYEAERIARTEINSANNKVAFNEIFNDETVQYKQWITCGDNRVRESHIELDEQITRVGDKFSNGLQYPGDHNGKAKEVINCRCTLIPYFLDWNKIPPIDKSYFYEKDLVELDEDLQKQVELQYDEDIKLAEVKQGYVELNKEIDIKVSPIQKLIQTIKKPIKQIENKTTNFTKNIQVYNKREKIIQNTTTNKELKYLQKLKENIHENNRKLIKENPELPVPKGVEMDYIILKKRYGEFYLDNTHGLNKEIGKKIDEMLMKMHEYTPKHFKLFSKDKQKGLLDWTGPGYEYLRPYLDPKKRNTLDPKYQYVAKNILRVLPDSFVKLKTPLSLKRGDGNLWLYKDNKLIDDVKKLKIGEVYNFNKTSYTSTSISMAAPFKLKYAKKGGIIFRLLAPEGTKVIPILQNSKEPKEAEIILDRGQEIQVLDIDETNKNQTYITAKIINTKKDIINNNQK
ncbi:phage minor head protein [uncultured Methanosphaera sp.]|uniref:phage minor head protein n=1 Tax=uncultured Methanosphaera sp. TaxID=262501 RepID=UPI002803DDB4|nr:phage minor head protein [uncultured Methanosphaera sp.]